MKKITTKTITALGISVAMLPVANFAEPEERQDKSKTSLLAPGQSELQKAQKQVEARARQAQERVRDSKEAVEKNVRKQSDRPAAREKVREAVAKAQERNPEAAREKMQKRAAQVRNDAEQKATGEKARQAVTEAKERAPEAVRERMQERAAQVRENAEEVSTYEKGRAAADQAKDRNPDLVREEMQERAAQVQNAAEQAAAGEKAREAGDSAKERLRSMQERGSEAADEAAAQAEKVERLKNANRERMARSAEQLTEQAAETGEKTAETIAEEGKAMPSRGQGSVEDARERLEEAKDRAKMEAGAGRLQAEGGETATETDKPKMEVSADTPDTEAEQPETEAEAEVAAAETAEVDAEIEQRRQEARKNATAETRKVLQDQRRRGDRDSWERRARKLDDEDDARNLIGTILGGAAAGAIAAEISTRDDARDRQRGRLPLSEVGRKRGEREETVEFLTRRFQGRASYDEAPRWFRSPYWSDRDRRRGHRGHHHPHFYNNNVRVVRYPSYDAIPPVLLGYNRLNRVETVAWRESSYYRSEQPSYYESLPEAYTGSDSYAVAYPVDPDSAVTQDDILFEQGTTNLADAYSFDLIVDIAEAINSSSLRDEQFVIEGHASAEGGYSSNLRLSQERAERIASDLVALGVSADRVIPVGYGESEARYPASAPESQRRLDRRVMVFRLAK